jgi:hypothetical protein
MGWCGVRIGQGGGEDVEKGCGERMGWVKGDGVGCGEGKCWSWCVARKSTNNAIHRTIQHCTTLPLHSTPHHTTPHHTALYSTALYLHEVYSPLKCKDLCLL